MRRRDEPRRAVAAPTLSLNLTPMIDVTFQLLIYFLLGASFVLGEEIYRIDLPDRSAPRSRAGGVLDEPIVVRIRSRSSAERDFDVELEGPMASAASGASLEDSLLANLVSADNPAGTISRSTPIVISPNADARWEHAVAVFDTAVKAGFVRVAFAPIGKDSPR